MTESSSFSGFASSIACAPENAFASACEMNEYEMASWYPSASSARRVF
jgi:hypothetical protein